MNDRPKTNDELRALMYEEARAAEENAALDEDDGAPLPAGTRVSRPNRPESLQERLDRIGAEAEAAEEWD